MALIGNNEINQWVNSGKVLPSNVEDNPEPSQNLNDSERCRD